MVRFGLALAVLLSTQVARADVVFKAKDHAATIDDMAFASDGSLVVAGTFFGKLTVGKKSVKPTEAGMRDGFVARIDAKGKVTWLVSTHGISQINSLAVAKTGDIAIGGAVEYLIGKETGPAADWRVRATVLVLGSDGKQRYRTEFPTQDRSWVGDLAFGPDSTVVACGTYGAQTRFGSRDVQSTPGQYVPSLDVFTIHLTADGAVDWLATGGGAEDDRSYSIAVAPNGDVVVAGDIGPASKFGSQKLSGPRSYAQAKRLGNPTWAFVVGYSAQGMLRYATQYQGHDSLRMQNDSLVVLSDGAALLRFEDMETTSAGWNSEYPLVSVGNTGVLASRIIDATELSTPGDQSLVTARLDVNDFVLDTNDAASTTRHSSVRRDPKVDVVLAVLARSDDGRFALASVVSALDPTITFGTTAAELLPKRAK